MKSIWIFLAMVTTAVVTVPALAAQALVVPQITNARSRPPDKVLQLQSPPPAVFMSMRSNTTAAKERIGGQSNFSLIPGYDLEVRLGVNNAEKVLFTPNPTILYPEGNEFTVTLRGKHMPLSVIWTDGKTLSAKFDNDGNKVYTISESEFPGTRHLLTLQARKKVNGPFGPKIRLLSMEIPLVVKYNTPPGAPKPPYYFGE